jgi:hypothetical protein
MQLGMLSNNRQSTRHMPARAQRAPHRTCMWAKVGASGSSSPHAPACCSSCMLAGVMVLTRMSGVGGASNDSGAG